jgi:hypothetical protein
MVQSRKEVDDVVGVGARSTEINVMTEHDSFHDESVSVIVLQAMMSRFAWQLLRVCVYDCMNWLRGGGYCQFSPVNRSLLVLGTIYHDNAFI